MRKCRMSPQRVKGKCVTAKVHERGRRSSRGGRKGGKKREMGGDEGEGGYRRGVWELDKRGKNSEAQKRCMSKSIRRD